MKKLKLIIELVPSTVWYSSLYRVLPNEVWNQIRNEIIKTRGKQCEICGEEKGVMNLHEVWEYDDSKHVQTLLGFQLLRTLCHHVKHIGNAAILAKEGKLDYGKVASHFCKVNNCDSKYFETYVKEAFTVWRKRSKSQLTQNFGKYARFVKSEETL